MEQEIEEIRTKIEEFMKKYNVTVEVKTVCEGRYLSGKIANPKAHLIITS